MHLLNRISIIMSLLLLATWSYAGNDKTYQSDTLNRTDENNLKQGWWIYYYKTNSAQKESEGKYENSRKQGIWKRYYESGTTKDEINYKNNRPFGYYKTYFDNGNVQEEGNWVNNRNTGSFKRYYENGQVSQEFKFDETGKRSGPQKYYYENGQEMIVGEWDGGKEAGLVTEYYENGDLKAEKYFNGGALDTEKTKVYESKTAKDPLKEEIAEAPEKVVKVDPKTVTTGSKTDVFTGSGCTKLYNKNKQLEKDGCFKNYRLMDGKWYRYNEDGILTKIEIYKGGRYIGDGVIEE